MTEAPITRTARQEYKRRWRAANRDRVRETARSMMTEAVQREASPADSALGRGVTNGRALLAHVNPERASSLSAEAEKAFLLDLKIRQRRLRLEAEFIELGRDLATMRDRELYRLLDFDTFEAWLASPELSFSRRTAYGLIAASDVCNRLHITPEAAGAIGWARLEILRPALLAGTGSPEDWLHDATTLSRGDLRQKVRAVGVTAPLTVEEEDQQANRQIARAVLEALAVDAATFEKFGALMIRKGAKTVKVHASGHPLKVEVI